MALTEDTDRRSREYVASKVSGMALFEAGVTIEGATRFRDMGRRGYAVPEDHELTAYFQYEIDSLRMYADYLDSVRVPVRVPECPQCVAVGNAYGMLASYGGYLYEGARRCVRCGRVWDLSDASKPKEVTR